MQKFNTCHFCVKMILYLSIFPSYSTVLGVHMWERKTPCTYLKPSSNCKWLLRIDMESYLAASLSTGTWMGNMSTFQFQIIFWLHYINYSTLSRYSTRNPACGAQTHVWCKNPVCCGPQKFTCSSGQINYPHTANFWHYSILCGYFEPHHFSLPCYYCLRTIKGLGTDQKILYVAYGLCLLYVNSEASYLSETHARRQKGGHFS